MMTRKRKALTALAVSLALAVAATAYVEFCIHPYLRLAVQSGGVYSTVWSYSLEYAEGATLDCYLTENQGQMQATFFVREYGDRVLRLRGNSGANADTVSGIALVSPGFMEFRCYTLFAQKVTDATPSHALGTWDDENAGAWVLSREVVHEADCWWIVFGYLNGGTDYRSIDLVDFVAEQSA